MADITERIVIPEVPRVLDGQELYVHIPKATSLNISQTTGDSELKVMSQKAVTNEINNI